VIEEGTFSTVLVIELAVTVVTTPDLRAEERKGTIGSLSSTSLLT